MNKEIYRKEINEKVKDIIVADESIEIVLDIRSLKFVSYHGQDCCEHVAADFSIFKYHRDRIVGKDLSMIVVKSVDKMGFLICFDEKYSSEKVFVPCYNRQNGYYSSDLQLKIEDGTQKVEIDISDCVEDDID